MRNLFRMTAATFNVMAGANITDTISEAIQVARENGFDFDNGALITFEFNGVHVSIKASSDPDLIYRDWSRALNGYIDKSVGPFPKPELSEEEKASDALIEAENERRRQERDAQHRAEARAHRERVEAKLSSLPEMEVSDPATWQDYLDKNGSLMAYTERWARLMQGELASGKTVAEVADATSHEADLEGITGAMYGWFVHALAQCWSHGDELRKWHNSQYGGDDDTEGTINPAVIRLSVEG